MRHKRSVLLAVFLLVLLFSVSITPALASPDTDTTSQTEEETSTPDDQDGGQGDAPAGEEETGENGTDAFGRLFGTLGLFAAMMAVLALGNEVVIDTTKFALGMKSKPTAMKAFNDFRSELPGQLRDLGASEEATKQLTDTIDKMKKTLEPAEKISDIKAQVVEGDIIGALEGLEELLDNTPADLEILRGQIAGGLRTGIGNVMEALKVPQHISHQVLIEVNNAVNDLLTAESLGNILQGKTEKMVSSLEKKYQDKAKAWLTEQLNEGGQIRILAKKGSASALKFLDKNLKPQLDKLGLKDDDFKNFRNVVEGQLDMAVKEVLDKSVPKLLETIQFQSSELSVAWLQTKVSELKNNSTASLLKKFDDELATPLKNLGLGDDNISKIRGQIENTLEELDVRVISGLLDLDALRQLMQTVENRRAEIQSPGRKAWRWLRSVPILGHGLAIEEPNNATNGDHKWVTFLRIHWPKAAGYPRGVGLLTWPEAVFNQILRRQPKVKELGKAAAVPPFTTSTMASRLLEMDNQHKDEESSRLRSLRIISVLMGITLAYMMQVNAIDLLSEAFEGISSVNESVDTQMVVGWLNRVLRWIPFVNEISVTNILDSNMTLDAGIILSGLAASAGSAFWHDMLERLQIAKKAAGQVQTVIQSVKGSTAEEDA